jgi:polysaccharide biosynthesis/export protein
MTRSLWLIAACIALFFSSCVPNKKFVYLQKGDVNKKGLALDTVVREYNPHGTIYQIQPEDLLSVRFESLTPDEFNFLSTGEGNQNMNFQPGNALLIGDLVDQQGEIPFPFIGKVKVAGKTVFQIQDSLQVLADKYLESPVVKVRLLNFRFTLLGEVNREGTVTLNNNRVSLIEAIGLAGGLTDLADKSAVKLIRQQNGKAQVVYVNLLDEDFINSPYYYVYQSDVVVVPALKQRPYRKYLGQNLSLVVSTLSLLVLTFSLTQ